MPTILPPKMLPQMIKGELLTPKSRGWKSPHSNLAPVSPLYIKWTAGKLHLNYTVRKSKRVLWPVALLTRFIYSPFFFYQNDFEKKLVYDDEKKPQKIKKTNSPFSIQIEPGQIQSGTDHYCRLDLPQPVPFLQPIFANMWT